MHCIKLEPANEHLCQAAKYMFDQVLYWSSLNSSTKHIVASNSMRLVFLLFSFMLECDKAIHYKRHRLQRIIDYLKSGRFMRLLIKLKSKILCRHSPIEKTCSEVTEEIGKIRPTCMGASMKS
jgi:hypothetical protein